MLGEMTMGIKFIHMGDVHLDTPFQSTDEEMRIMLKRSLYDTFQIVINMAIQRDVDAILIAGDLFDSENLSFFSQKFLLSMFKLLKDRNIQVYYTPGNHDPIGYNILNIPWPDNVHIFSSAEPTTLPVKDKYGNNIAFITGVGHENATEGRNLAAVFPDAKECLPNIALLHCMVLDGGNPGLHDRYAPCTLSDIENKGYVYWALGHIHKRREICKSPVVVYPGNIMGRNPKEEGLKGVYYVEIENGLVNTKFYPVAPVCWLTIEVDGLEDIGNLYELENRLKQLVENRINSINAHNIKFVIRIILKGPCPLYHQLLNKEDIMAIEDSLRISLGALFIEILVSQITIPIDIDDYKGKPHILGTVLDMIDNIKEDDELLLKMKPEILAGYGQADEQESETDYLKKLLDGLDYEACVRLIGEIKNED
jgi:DNA repair protein SbcD/Mre11